MGSPNRCYRGMVARTADAIDPQARTLRKSRSIFPIPMKDRARSYVEAKLVVRTTDAVWVPTSAMMFRTRGPQVAVVDANGTIHFRDVVIARDYGNFLKISSGLKAGDRVAANINNQIVDGQKVSVTDAPQVVTGDASSALTSEDLAVPKSRPIEIWRFPEAPIPEGTRPVPYLMVDHRPYKCSWITVAVSSRMELVANQRW